MREIKEINVVHHYLMDIAKAVNSILAKYKIPFVMAYGTMLGAIRHKGFIPWDDDMDFYVPFSRYDEIFEILHKELKFPYEVVSYKTHRNCHIPFFKVQDVRTCLDDKGSYNRLEDNLGINIDLFPVTFVDPGDSLINRYKRIKRLQRLIYARDVYSRWYTEPMKKIFRLICPISEKKFNDVLNSLPLKFLKGDMAFSFGASQRYNEILPKIFFEKIKLYSFEDCSFWGAEDADGYLKTYYGDYMRLPPEDKRQWHADGIYDRENVSAV